MGLGQESDSDGEVVSWEQEIAHRGTCIATFATRSYADASMMSSPLARLPPGREEAVTAQRRLASYSGAAGQERFEEAVSTILATVGASVEGALTVEVKEDPKPTKGSWVSPPVVIPTLVGVAVLLLVVNLVAYFCCTCSCSRRKSPRCASTPGMPSDRMSKMEPDGVVDVESVGQAPGASIYQADL